MQIPGDWDRPNSEAQTARLYILGEQERPAWVPDGPNCSVAAPGDSSRASASTSSSPPAADDQIGSGVSTANPFSLLRKLWWQVFRGRLLWVHIVVAVGGSRVGEDRVNGFFVYKHLLLDAGKHKHVQPRWPLCGSWPARLGFGWATCQTC